MIRLLLLLLCFAFVRRAHSSELSINVINLENDTDRWENLVQDLSTKGVPLTAIHRLPAVYGKHLSKRELETKATRLARLFCTPGMIGCYLSHVKFWWKVASEPEPYQMVLEDDAVVSEHFHDRSQQMVDELQDNLETKDNWDVLLLGAFSCVHPERKYGIYRGQAMLFGDGRRQQKVTPHIQIPHRPLGTHAYILSQRGAQKLLRLASKATWHVDCVIWGIPELDLFLCDPMLVFQDTESPSTVGAITKGVETWLPKWQIDDYTGASFEWAMNEPFLRVPIVNLTITIGRYISLFISGTIAAIALQGNIPSWILPTHVGLCIGFAFAFVRIMKKPQKLEMAIGDLLDDNVAVSSNLEHINSVITDSTKTDSEGDTLYNIRDA